MVPTMQAICAVNSVPIPGYRLLEPLGKGGFGEVWKCEAPGGFCKAIKFVRSQHELGRPGNDYAKQELRALENLKSVRHPFLLNLERVEFLDGMLIIVTELADRSLHDLLVEYRQLGYPGIPRAEVIGYMREAAEVLDLMNQEHGLKHLDIKPKNLFLIGRHIKVADFGLVSSLADLYSQQDLLGGITPLYAAPEVFEGRPTLYSDQYSLAITYHELLTGHPVFEGKNFNHQAYLIAGGEPDLSRVGEPDREVLKKALSKIAQDRYPSCTAFVSALQSAGEPVDSAHSRLSTFEDQSGEFLSGQYSSDRTRNIRRRESKLIKAIKVATPPPVDILSGYKLLECLSRGDLGELWQAIGPRGDAKLVRFLLLSDSNSKLQTAGLDRIVALNHPSLAEAEVLSGGSDRLALVSEAGEKCLGTRLKECRTSGLTGIPRQELLRYLASLSQALDELYAEEQLQHLLLSPRHLALSRGEPILLEFGLVELLWLARGLSVTNLNPRYSAVELFEGLVSDACDQYSLALIYPELLIGVHPFRNLNPRQLASAKFRGQPDLALLPGPDRKIVLQALSEDPRKRFRSCREFISALEECSRQTEQAAVTTPTSYSTLKHGLTPLTIPALQSGGAVAGWRVAHDELVQAVSHGHEIQTAGLIHYRYTPESHLEHHGWVRLAPGMARLKMVSFRDQWNAEIVEQSHTRWSLAIRNQATMWQKWMGTIPGVLLEVVIGQPRDLQNQMTSIRIHVQALDRNKHQAAQILCETGVAILTSLQGYFNIQNDKSSQERYPLTQEVQVEMPAANLKLKGKLRDLGRKNLTIIAERSLPAGVVKVVLRKWNSQETFEAAGWIRESHPISDRHFEIDIDLPG